MFALSILILALTTSPISTFQSRPTNDESANISSARQTNSRVDRVDLNSEYWPIHPLGDRLFDLTTQIRRVGDMVIVEYRLELSELTMLAELIELVGVGNVPATRPECRRRFRDEVGPILERGLTLAINGSAVELKRATLENMPGEAATILIRDPDDRGENPVFEYVFSGRLTGGKEPLAIEIRDDNFEGERVVRRVGVATTNPVDRLATLQTFGIPQSTDDSGWMVESGYPESATSMPRKSPWETTAADEEVRRRIQFRYHPAPYATRTSTVDANDPQQEVSIQSGQLERSNRLKRSNEALGGREPGLNDFFDVDRIGLTTALIAAVGVGIVHAIKPGHGKTIVASYLVGCRGTARQAIFLGVVTTLAHTSTVIATAFLLQPIGGTRWANPETVRFLTMFVGGSLLIVVGLFSVLRAGSGAETSIDEHLHDVDLELGGAETGVDADDGNRSIESMNKSRQTDPTDGSSVERRSAVSPRSTSWFRLTALGVSGGLIPCDDAVILLIWAIGSGRLSQGIYLLLAFSAGMSFVLVALGLVAVKIRRKAFAGSNARRRRYPIDRIGRFLLFATSSVIVAVGLNLCVSAFYSPTPLR